MVTMTECIKSTGVVLMSNYYLMAYELKTVESVPTLLKLTERFYVGIRRAQLPHLPELSDLQLKDPEEVI